MQEEMPARSCPVCGTTLQPIQVVERGHLNRQLGGLRYAAGGAQPKRLMGMPITGEVALEGTLGAWLCSDCGRVQFYAVPDAGPTELTPAPTGRGDEPSPTD